MAYSAEADLEQAAGSAARLVELTDWDNTGALDTTKMNNAIAEADSLIDSYLVKQYSVPLGAPVPVVIVKLSARLAIFFLKVPRGMANEPIMALTYERDLKWLDGVAKGDIAIGAAPQPPPSPLRGADGYTDRPRSKAISRRKLHGFS